MDNFSCTCRYQQIILSHSPPKVSNHEVNSQHSSYVMFLVISCKKLSWDRQLLRESESVPQRIWPTSSPALTPPVFFGILSLMTRIDGFEIYWQAAWLSELNLQLTVLSVSVLHSEGLPLLRWKCTETPVLSVFSKQRMSPVPSLFIYNRNGIKNH